MTTPNHRRYDQVGIDRMVRLKWLERTASLVLAGNTRPTVKEILQNDLKDSFRSDNPNVRGSIDKTITILRKVWVRVSSDLEPLRLDGLDLLRRCPRHNHVAIHWGMVSAVYPFWSAVATQAGRLLRLQGSVSAVHVQRRVREQYGERETVSRRARYVLRSYLDWGVLQETGKKGIYTAGQAFVLDNVQLVSWLVEALLHAHPKGLASLKSLLESPSLFPFVVKPMPIQHKLRDSTRLEVVRHGLDEDFVMLRK